MRTFYAVALTAATILSPIAASPTAAPPPSGVRVDSWVTSADGQQRLDPQPATRFGTALSPRVTIEVDPTRTYQEVQGFGASLTDSSAALISALPAAERDRVMRMLFDDDEGIGLSALRQAIGSSDFTHLPEHYDLLAPDPDGFGDVVLPDEAAATLELAAEAVEMSDDMTVIASPWSPPAALKTNGILAGGGLIPGMETQYARYLAGVVEAFDEAGVPADYITVQNEPQISGRDDYPNAHMRAAQAAEVIRAFGVPAYLRGLDTRVLGFDHNWSLHPADVAGAGAGGHDYAADLLDDPRLWAMKGMGFHCYYGDPSAMTAVHEQYPDEALWVTECSGSHGPDASEAQVFRDTLTWQSRMLTIGSMRNWASGVMGWNVALDADGGPHLAGAARARVSCRSRTGRCSRTPSSTCWATCRSS